MKNDKKRELDRVRHRMDELQRKFDEADRCSQPLIAENIEKCYRSMKKLTGEQIDIYRYVYPTTVKGTALYHRLRSIVATGLFCELSSHSVILYGGSKASYLVHIESSKRLTTADRKTIWNFIDGAIAMFNY